jgi:hypothetical protein
MEPTREIHVSTSAVLDNSHYGHGALASRPQAGAAPGAGDSLREPWAQHARAAGVGGGARAKRWPGRAPGRSRPRAMGSTPAGPGPGSRPGRAPGRSRPRAMGSTPAGPGPGTQARH